MQHRGPFQFHAFIAAHIAFDLAENYHILGHDVCVNPAVGTDGQAVTAEFNAAFDFSIHEEVLSPGKLTFYDDCAANPRDIGLGYARGFAARVFQL